MVAATRNCELEPSLLDASLRLRFPLTSLPSLCTILIFAAKSPAVCYAVSKRGNDTPLDTQHVLLHHCPASS